MAATDLIDHLASQGRYHFTTKLAVERLGVSITAARAAIRRLVRKGLVATPFRGFHVIVPPEYRQLGCLPADQFVPQLMEHLGLYYYAALLTAGRYHGDGVVSRSSREVSGFAHRVVEGGAGKRGLDVA